jgi:hypothetical protein
MDQNVAEGDYLRPGNLWMPSSQLVGDTRRGFAYDRKLLNNCAPNQLRFQECFKIAFPDERADVIRGLDYVVQV